MDEGVVVVAAIFLHRGIPYAVACVFLGFFAGTEYSACVLLGKILPPSLFCGNHAMRLTITSLSTPFWIPSTDGVRAKTPQWSRIAST